VVRIGGLTLAGQLRSVSDDRFPAAQLPLMRHSITLNVRYDQPQPDWDKVKRVYESALPAISLGSEASTIRNGSGRRPSRAEFSLRPR